MKNHLCKMNFYSLKFFIYLRSRNRHIQYFFIIYLMIEFTGAVTLNIDGYKYSNNSPVITKTLVSILKFCDKQYDTIIVYGDTDENIVKSLFISQPLVSIISYKDLTSTKQPIQHTKQIDTVIINKQSLKQIKNILSDFEKTPWWNIMIPYFILENTSHLKSDVFPILDLLLEKEILVAYIITLNEFGHVTIITMNPFANYAPLQWNYSAMIRNQAVAYFRLYDKYNICQGFYFDRTTYINGHKIYVVLTKNGYQKVHGSRTYNEKNISHVIRNPRLLFLNALATSLNLTFDIKIIPFMPLNISIEFYTNLYIEKRVDLIMGQVINMSEFDNTFPYKIFNFKLFMQNRGFKTFPEKLWDFYGSLTLISMTVILIITLVVIRLRHKNKTIEFSMFEILRLLINASILTKMNFSSLRIFFSMIFLYFLILQATFSGNIIKFLTKPELRKIPNTLDDIKGMQYKNVYIFTLELYDSLRSEFENQEISAITFHNISKCFTAINEEKSNICILPDQLIMGYVLYLQYARAPVPIQSSKGLSFSYNRFQTRKHWPLNTRVNQFFIQLFESGLSTLDDLQFNKSVSNYINRIQTKPEFVSLNLDMLTFAFVLLGVGLTCAVIIFVIEVCYSQIKKRIL